MEGILHALSQYGLPGVIIALMAFFIWHQDGELKSERAARLADVKLLNEQALKTQSEVIGAVNKMALIFEELRKSFPGRRP